MITCLTLNSTTDRLIPPILTSVDIRIPDLYPATKKLLAFNLNLFTTCSHFNQNIWSASTTPTFYFVYLAICFSICPINVEIKIKFLRLLIHFYYTNRPKIISIVNLHFKHKFWIIRAPPKIQIRIVSTFDMHLTNKQIIQLNCLHLIWQNFSSFHHLHSTLSSLQFSDYFTI